MDCVENFRRCDAHFSSFWKRCRFGIKNLAQDFRDKNPKWDLIGWSTWAFEWSAAAAQFLQHACNWRQIKNFWFKSWNTKLETYDQEEWSVYVCLIFLQFLIPLNCFMQYCWFCIWWVMGFSSKSRAASDAELCLAFKTSSDLYFTKIDDKVK